MTTGSERGGLKPSEELRAVTAARFWASASLERWPISRRSNCASTASTFAIISPAGVVVSTPRSSAISAHRLLRAALYQRGEIHQAAR
jgi:hypothetical protein